MVLRTDWHGAMLLLLAGGCLPSLPVNTNSAGPPERTILSQTAQASFEQEAGVADAQWVQITPSDGSAPIGGYLSQNTPRRGALVILLHGASTYSPTGRLGSAWFFHATFGPPFRDAGYLTWSLDNRECGTAWGEGDVADVLQVLDWLDREGRTLLGVDRVYLVGYSTGATIAVNVNRQRTLTAIAAISPLTEPNQIEDNYALYRLVAALYPNNEGICQLRDTLATYGPPWSAGWDTIDTVAHVDQLRSPMLVLQGTRDQIFNISNTRDLEAAYSQALAAGAQLPPAQFIYLSGEDHFQPENDPPVKQDILDFFASFEPAK